MSFNLDPIPKGFAESDSTATMMKMLQSDRNRNIQNLGPLLFISLMFIPDRDEV